MIEFYGTEYGGFYVENDLMAKHNIVYSFGIGQDLSFSESLLNRFDCEIFAFDFI